MFRTGLNFLNVIFKIKRRPKKLNPRTITSDVKMPKTCLLTVTNRCVLRCKMCNLWQLDTSEDEISIEDCKRLVDSLKRFNTEPIDIHIIGGESLIKKGILELVKYISKRGHRTVITSSGYPINKHMARKIVDSGLNTLNLSLDSLNPEVHDFLRGSKGCFQRVMNAIEYFGQIRHRRMSLGINSIIAAANLDSIIELTEWVQQDKRINSFYLMAVMRPFGSDLGWDWQENKAFDFLWPSDLAKVNATIDKLIHFKNAGYKIDNSTAHLKIFKEYFNNPQKFIKTQRCNILDHAININALGDIHICFFMRKLGNIKTDDISERWFSEEASCIRKEMATCRNNCELIINCYYQED